MNSKTITKSKKSNKKKSINYFENLKSDYFLIKVFGNIKRNKSLGVVQYNKILQKRLNFNINDYKEYSQLYSSIEIEIHPYEIPNSKFINISDKDKEYFHIYFDNSKEEIKRNYFNEDEKKVKTIKIKIDYQVESFEQLFENCTCIFSINFKKFYRKNITDMSFMFYKCEILNEINFSSFDCSNVTNMKSMFAECKFLEELNLSNFNTNNVTDMSNMFGGCTALKKINVSSFNTENVTQMNSMFDQCSSLEEINLSNFNTSNVTNMGYMFYKCKTLKKLDLSNFNDNKLERLFAIFSGCSSLTEINLSNFYNYFITSVERSILEHCSSLKKLILPCLNTNDVQNAYYILQDCHSLKELNFNHFDRNDLEHKFYKSMRVKI